MVSETSLCNKIAVLAAKSQYWTNAKIWISELISQAYGFDAPWGWHLQRVIADEANRAGFVNEAWTKQFVDSYISTLNVAEAQVFADTGFTFALRS